MELSDSFRALEGWVYSHISR